MAEKMAGALDGDAGEFHLAGDPGAEVGGGDAGAVAELEDGAVAQAEGIGDVGAGEEAVDFFGAEGFGEVAGLFARQVEIYFCGWRSAAPR